MRLAILLFCSIFITMSFAKIGPTELVNMPMNIKDDLSFEHLLRAITRQERSFRALRGNPAIKFGKRNLDREHLKKSLKAFRALVVKALNCYQIHDAAICESEFNETLKDQFEAYRPIPSKGERGHKVDKTLFTAYYSPDLHGSRIKTARFKNPIYRLPKDKKLRSASSDQINYEKVLAGKNLELFYVKESLFDIWLLHVEGGGRVQVNIDGKIEKFYLSYHATNKQSFNFLSRYMVANGLLGAGETSVENQRRVFENNPLLQRDIMASCPSYVFFKETTDEPFGVNNIPLTPGRSLATDYRIHKEYGIINFIKAKRPVKINGKMVFKDFGRFFINQDTGGAIKGNARSDLYFGYGEEAELTANFLNTLGEQYFIILK